MLRQTPNRRHRWLAPANSGLESSYESRPGYHPVEVHTQAGPTQVSLHNQAVEALAACWGLRIVGQAMWMYFDLVLRKEAPNPFVGDILLFLSNIPVLAALLLQLHMDPVEGRKSQGTVDFLLLLLWWLYLYLFFVIPWQYVVLDEARYGW